MQSDVLPLQVDGLPEFSPAEAPPGAVGALGTQRPGLQPKGAAPWNGRDAESV